jgi:hypothetical protein
MSILNLARKTLPRYTFSGTLLQNDDLNFNVWARLTEAHCRSQDILNRCFQLTGVGCIPLRNLEVREEVEMFLYLRECEEYRGMQRQYYSIQELLKDLKELGEVYETVRIEFDRCRYLYQTNSGAFPYPSFYDDIPF